MGTGDDGQDVLVVLVDEPMFFEDCNGAKASQVPLLPRMVVRHRNSKIQERFMVNGVVFVLVNDYVSLVGKTADSDVVIVVRCGESREGRGMIERFHFSESVVSHDIHTF